MSYGGRVPETLSTATTQVVARATAEARALGHPHVGTEHLLLGLLSDEGDGPALLLRDAGASLAAARHKVTEVVSSEDGTAAGELPFTARAQRALDRAARFSRQNREPEVTANDVLLGVLDVEGLACQVLRGLGVDVGNLRNALVATRSGADSSVGLEAPSTEPAEPSVEPRCPWCQAALDGSLAETVLTTQGDVEQSTVSVVFCGSCGATLGIVRPPAS